MIWLLKSIKDIEKEFKSKMMLNIEQNVSSNQIKEFVEFVENYDPKLKNKLKLKNETLINISESDFNSLKKMFDTLNNKNREIFVGEITESPAKLKSNLEFYKKAQRILK